MAPAQHAMDFRLGARRILRDRGKQADAHSVRVLGVPQRHEVVRIDGAHLVAGREFHDDASSREVWPAAGHRISPFTRTNGRMRGHMRPHVFAARDGIDAGQGTF